MSRGKWFVQTSALVLAGTLGMSRAAAEGASVDSATKAQLKTATEHYDRGVEAMDAEKYADALTYFQHSYDTVASPNSRMMVGRAFVRLGRLPEAYRELAQALKQANELAATQKRYKKTVETIQKELDEIKDKLAYVTVRQDSQLQLQGENIASTNWREPLPVMPGTVSAVVTFADGRKLNKQLTLKAGERAELSVDPPPLAATQSAAAANQAMPPAVVASPSTSDLNRRTVGYVLGAVGIVGVGAFVGLTLIAAPSYGDTKSDCVNGACLEGSIDKQATKSTVQGIGYTALGVGVVGLGVGTWLILSGGSKDQPTTALKVGLAGVEFRQRF